MPSIKSRFPTKVLAILILAIVVIAILVTLHFVGIIDLSPLGAYFLGTFAYGSQSIITGILVFSLLVGGGMFVGYSIHKYAVNIKIPPAAYAPQGQTISNNQQQTDTVISQ